jgi:hypothetical protein
MKIEKKLLSALKEAVNFIKDSKNLTYDDLEEELKLSRKTIRKYISSGEGQEIKLNKFIKYLQKEAPQFFHDELSQSSESTQIWINDDLGNFEARELEGQTRRIRPDPLHTPGSCLPIPVHALCKPIHFQSISIPSVPLAWRQLVCMQYGIVYSRYGKMYKMDYLIPFELGGLNDINNIWPQPIRGQWNCHDKNRLEKRLRELVCSGQLPLEQAQKEISTDWIAAYQKYIQ